MAILCGKGCSFNQGGLCNNTVCTTQAIDNVTREKMLKRATQLSFYTVDGLYFETVTDLCNYYNIKRNRFNELITEGMYWGRAIQECIMEREQEKAQKHGAMVDYGNTTQHAWGIRY